MYWSSLTSKLYEVDFRNLKEYVINEVAKEYSKKFGINLNELKRYLERIPIYISDLGKKFGGTVLGAYKFYTDGKSIYSPEIYISPIVLSNPILFIRTISEELSHALQSYLGFIKGIKSYALNFFRKIHNIYEYFNHPLEKEAKEIAEKVTSKYFFSAIISLYSALTNSVRNIYKFFNKFFE